MAAFGFFFRTAVHGSLGVLISCFMHISFGTVWADLRGDLHSFRQGLDRVLVADSSAALWLLTLSFRAIISIEFWIAFGG